MKRRISLLFFVLNPLLSYTQSVVQGIISDLNTGEMLMGVSVRTENMGTTSDANGRYRLTLPAGRTTISFSYVGYATQQRTLDLRNNEQVELNIRLDDGSNILNTATVTSGKFEKPLGEVTVSLDVVKPRLIENTNTTNVTSVLTKVPGVTILDGQAQIRGGSGFSYGAGTRVLLLVDDMPVLQPDAGFPNWADLPVENLAQVEVLKGAASALYGSSAMNGIINLRTGYAKDKPETTAAVWGKLTGAPRAPAHAWWKDDTSQLWMPYETGFNFVHRRRAGNTDFVLGGFALTSQSYNQATFSDYARLTPNFRFRIHDRLNILLNSNFNIGRSGSFFVWENDTFGALRPGMNSASRSKGRLRFNIDPILLYTDRAGNRHKILSRYYHVWNNNDRNQSNFSKNVYAEYQFQKNFEPIQLVLTSGVVGQRSVVDAQLYGNQRYSANNLAAYLQFDWKPLERLNLSAGGRLEHFEQYSAELIKNLDGNFDTIPGGLAREKRPVFRFGANYQLARATYFRASFGQGFRYPTIAEKFITTDFSVGNFIVPNGKLQSEWGWTAEAGIKQGFKIGRWTGYVDLTGFQSDYSRMMEFVLAKIGLEITPGGLKTKAFFQSQNVGDTRIPGYELSVVGQGKLGEGNLYLLAGYTRTFPRYKNFEKDGRSSSNDSVNVLKYRYEHAIKWDSEYEWRRFSLGLACQYNSFMRAIDAVFESEFVPAFGAVRRFRRENNKGAAVWDVRFAWKPTDQLRIAWLVNNFTNTLYKHRPALLESPRNFTIRLEYKI